MLKEILKFLREEQEFVIVILALIMMTVLFSGCSSTPVITDYPVNRLTQANHAYA